MSPSITRRLCFSQICWTIDRSGRNAIPDEKISNTPSKVKAIYLRRANLEHRTEAMADVNRTANKDVREPEMATRKQLASGDRCGRKAAHTPEGTGADPIYQPNQGAGRDNGCRKSHCIWVTEDPLVLKTQPWI